MVGIYFVLAGLQNLAYVTILVDKVACGSSEDHYFYFWTF
jgi:hypothetical protein